MTGATGLEIVSARAAIDGAIAWEASDGIHLPNRTQVLPGTLRDIERARDTYLVAYDLGDDLLLARLNDEGEIESTTSLRIPASDAAIARTGNAMLLFTGKKAILTDVNGVIERRTDITSADAIDPVIAANSQSFLAVWRQPKDLIVRTVLLDAEGRIVTGEIRHGWSPEGPTVASDGTNFLVAWRSGTDTIVGVLIGPDGKPLTNEFQLTTSIATRPVLAVRTGGYRLYFTLNGSLRYADVTSAGAGSQPFTVLPNGRKQEAEDAGGARVVWIERGFSVDGARVMSWAPTDKAPLLVSKGEAVRTTPVITAFGNDFAVAYAERTDVARYYVRLSADRRVAVSSDQIRTVIPVAMASDGQRVLVAWWDASPTTRYRLNAAVLEADGTIVNKVPFIDEMFGRYVTAAWNGSEYVIAGTDYHFNNVGVVAVRISRDGRLLDGETREVAPRSYHTATTNADSRDPSIVWTGNEYLVIRDEARVTARSETINPEIHEVRVQRVSSQLQQVGDDRLVAPFGLSPVAAAGPTDTLIVWYGDDGLLHLRLLATNFETTVDVDTTARPSIVAAGTSFIIAAGRHVFRLGGTELTTLPEGTTESSIARNGTRLMIAYTLGNEIYLREIALESGRGRAVRH